MTDPYWYPFNVREPGSSLIAVGPYATRERAIAARRSALDSSHPRECVGLVFAAESEDEAMKIVHRY